MLFSAMFAGSHSFKSPVDCFFKSSAFRRFLIEVIENSRYLAMMLKYGSILDISGPLNCTDELYKVVLVGEPGAI